MHKLILFDIDGTLVTGVRDGTLVASAVEDRFTQAIRNAVGTNIAHSKDFRGSTDYLILVTLLQDIGWEDAQIQSAMPMLLKELDAVHEKTFEPAGLQLLPGVQKLLTALQTAGVKIGLITGNLEPVAKRKLTALGVWHFFSVGGFGSDPHVARSELVQVAVSRAGFTDSLSDVYVVGDTPKDIEAGKLAGITHTVGVVNGFRDKQELIDAHAEIVLDNFTDTPSVLRAFGLGT